LRKHLNLLSGELSSLLEILIQNQEIIQLPANAIKYGREGGTILLDVHEDKDVLKIKMEEKR
jgi:signal transduction histidine kinase